MSMYQGATAKFDSSEIARLCMQVLKIDRHKYVKIAYHGFKPMSREDRLNTYSNSDVHVDRQAPLTKLVFSTARRTQ
jgi:5' nucleotidase family